MKDKREVIDHDIKAVMEDLLLRAQFAKTEMCKDDPMTDNPPVVLIAVESDDTNPDHDVCVEFQQEKGLSKPLHIAMLPLIHKEDVYDCYEDVVKALPIRPFEFIVLALEGYGHYADEEGMDLTNYQRGAMEEDYKNNPFSTVREGLILTAVDYNATALWSVMSTYRYDDHGVPMYDEPKASVNEINKDDEEGYGRLGDALISTATYMNLAVKTLAYNDLLRKATDKKEG